MASYQITSPSALADELVCVIGIGAGSENNITASSAGRIYVLEADNTKNTNFGIYINIADAASATAGTTNPVIRVFVPGAEKTSFVWPHGHAYSSGISVWATTDEATSSTSGPTNNVDIKLVVTA